MNTTKTLLLTSALGVLISLTPFSLTPARAQELDPGRIPSDGHSEPCNTCDLDPAEHVQHGDPAPPEPPTQDPPGGGGGMPGTEQ